MKEGAFDYVNEEEINSDDDDKENKVKRRKRDKAERFSQRTEGKRNADSDNAEGSNYEPFAGFAFVERCFCCTYHKDDEGLGSKRFNEPACLEKLRGSVKNQEQHTVSKIIENRT